VQPVPPAVDAENQIDTLQSKVGKQSGVPEQDREKDVVCEAGRPVPNISFGDEPYADRAGGESKCLGQVEQ